MSTSADSRLLSLPEDLLARICVRLPSPSLVNLMLTCRSLHSLLFHSQSLWITLSHSLSRIPLPLLRLWSLHLPSPLHLHRFISAVHPLLGLWAHQNPELGNLLLVLPSFLSLIALRIVPQELSSSLLFSPVFELLADPASPSAIPILLHSGQSSLHPGLLPLPVPRSPNLLLLEAGGPRFSRLSFANRRRLLDLVSDRVSLSESPGQPILPNSDFSNIPDLARRWRSLLLLPRSPLPSRVLAPGPPPQPRSPLSLLKSKILGRNRSMSPPDHQHIQLAEFLGETEGVRLTLRPMRAKLTTYRGWPSMHENRFALYKLDVQEGREGRELAGVWGGTFGWPPACVGEDGPGKAMFLLLLSYEEVEGSLVLLGTKVLEGTHYVLHPNGSAMFSARMEEASDEVFPWEMDGEGQTVEVRRAVCGEGIVRGYGFRYPGSNPGTLYVMEDGMLAFVWKESKSVLTIRRVDLEELLRKGERVVALPPISNFVYLTKSYSNVFMASANNSDSCLESRKL